MPNNNSSLYVFSTTPNVSSNNFTTLYSNAAAIPVQGAYGNSNVEAFLNQGTDGGNTVENILANGNIIANGSVTVGGNLSVVGKTNLGSVTNVHIAGGTLNYVLATDGTGNLSWAPQVDNAGNTQTFTITPGNYTVTTFLTALNAQLANGINNFLGITVT